MKKRLARIPWSLSNVFLSYFYSKFIRPNILLGMTHVFIEGIQGNQNTEKELKEMLKESEEAQVVIDQIANTPLVKI